MKRLRVFNITLTDLLSLLFIMLGIFHFGSSYLRLFESLGDLWQSIRYFVCKDFWTELQRYTDSKRLFEDTEMGYFFTRRF